MRRSLSMRCVFASTSFARLRLFYSAFERLNPSFAFGSNTDQPPFGFLRATLQYKIVVPLALALDPLPLVNHPPTGPLAIALKQLRRTADSAGDAGLRHANTCEHDSAQFRLTRIGTRPNPDSLRADETPREKLPVPNRRRDESLSGTGQGTTGRQPDAAAPIG